MLFYQYILELEYRNITASQKLPNYKETTFLDSWQPLTTMDSRWTKSSLARAYGMGLCERCILLCLVSRCEDLIKDEQADLGIHINSQLNKHSECLDFTMSMRSLCPSCLGVLDDVSISHLVALTLAGLEEKSLTARPLNVLVRFPPILELMRIGSRTVITQRSDKLHGCSSHDDVLKRLLETYLSKKGLKCSPATSDAVANVEVTVQVDGQLLLCSIYSDNFQKKKKKRRLGSSAAAEDENSIGQPDADVILSKLKQSSVAEYDAIRERIQSCMQNNFTAENVKLAVTVSSASIYLLGRYRKLARDVPQAAWTIDNERRGRNSVEEIVSEQVVKILRARSCRMHACGREDIDVRCLGNGRPFALEVEDALEMPTEEKLQQVVAAIAAREGLNSSGDVEVVMLKKSDAATWHHMQAAAEEKRKGYRCVVWVSNPVDSKSLRLLEHASKGVRGHAIPCPAHDDSTDSLEGSMGKQPSALLRCVDRESGGVHNDSGQDGNGDVDTVKECRDDSSSVSSNKKAKFIAENTSMTSLSHAVKVGGGGGGSEGSGEEVEVDRGEVELQHTVGKSLPDKSSVSESSDGKAEWQGVGSEEPCLQIIQKTPLRVLHRRSLLSRPRCLYDIQATQLNAHFFLLDLVTDAGTYVKEFVHGDFGRTVPSVASMLGCQAEILQLDVVWLFDDFEGGGRPPSTWRDLQETTFTPTSSSPPVIPTSNTSPVIPSLCTSP